MWRGATHEQLREIRRCDEIHIKRLNDIKNGRWLQGSLDNSPPKTLQLGRLRTNRKRERKRKEEELKIIRENKRLVTHINALLSNPQKALEYQQPFRPKVSRKYIRNEISRRINLENKALAKRIRNQEPVYKAKDMHVEYRIHQKHLRDLSYFTRNHGPIKTKLPTRKSINIHGNLSQKDFDRLCKMKKAGKTTYKRDSDEMILQELLKSDLEAQSILDLMEETKFSGKKSKAKVHLKRKKLLLKPTGLLPKKTDIICTRHGLRFGSRHYALKATLVGNMNVLELSFFCLEAPIANHIIRLEKRAFEKLCDDTMGLSNSDDKTSRFLPTKNRFRAQLIRSIIPRVRISDDGRVKIQGCNEIELKRV